MNDMIIPVNAKGFESLLYEFSFYDKQYTEEIIEADTKRLVEWLDNLNVDELTAEDEAIVNEMNMIYFMMSNGQKAFVSAENVAKLEAAIEKIKTLTATIEA